MNAEAKTIDRPETSAVIGSLLGTAVGDALGLPYEGISPQRARRMLGPPDRYRLLPGRGMVSDDTEHACLVAQALIVAGNDVETFKRNLAKRLRGWLLTLPAGTGMATLRSCCKLCVGVSPDRSGVFSAGNGPAMRSPLIGAAVDDVELMKQLVRVSTRITHTDPQAEWGALAVALAARTATRGGNVDGADFLTRLRTLLAGEPADELLARLERAAAGAARGESTTEFAISLGLEKGVTGYVNHTVPVAIHAWLARPNDFRAAVTEVIRCGGDADSTAAIVGGIVGASVGRAGIPRQWVDALWEWPRNIAWMERLAMQLHDVRTSGEPSRAPTAPLPAVMLRNAVFLTVVLAHGFRRLLPPY